jgi:amidohydrolase
MKPGVLKMPASEILGCAAHAQTLRHELHSIPELHYEERQTAALIRRELDRLGLKHAAGLPGAETATIAVIGDASKPCVALRADIDALPIQEQTGAPYASRHPGRMHACGHDGHTAILLGTAALLQNRQRRCPFA